MYPLDSLVYPLHSLVYRPGVPFRFTRVLSIHSDLRVGCALPFLQENVGRQGQQQPSGEDDGSGWSDGGGGGVAHGIGIITAADYFSLGNRQQAYLDIGKTVAAFDR